jgi:hypothetical protein
MPTQKLSVLLEYCHTEWRRQPIIVQHGESCKRRGMSFIVEPR